jgi:2-hydroxychromene-2-carboxylate isomerase
MKRPPRLYFSLRSPFSWMALRQLDERRPGILDHFEFVPFFEPDATTAAELHARGGEMHYVAMSKAKHLYILADTKRLAKRFGYQMTWPVDVDPWWELPHLAWLKARELGQHTEFYAAVMAARWERGENICDTDTLRRICYDAGLNGDVLTSAPQDDDIREQGVAALLDVYHNDVFGVPYFVVGRQRFWGLDRIDHVIEEMDARLVPST